MARVRFLQARSAASDQKAATGVLLQHEGELLRLEPLESLLFLGVQILSRPAMEGGIANHVWTIEEIVALPDRAMDVAA